MPDSFWRILILFIICLLTITDPITSEAKKKKRRRNDLIKVLIIDGQSKNHPHWYEWTPVLLQELDDSGLFQFDVATSPMKGESLDSFNPKLKNYDVVVTIYDGDIWSMRLRRNFENYIANGGGMVVIHAADNAFPEWPAYNKMIGLGGWGNRDEKAGPYLYVNDEGKIVSDISPGPAGHHGPPREYRVKTYKEDHPIMHGLPKSWLHAKDELYEKLRGPVGKMEILATAYSDEKYDGTGRNEPVLMTITYEKGRIFHTVMGHDRKALSCVGFMTTFIRGCEWAATGEVTFEVPDDFPKKDKISIRDY